MKDKVIRGKKPPVVNAQNDVEKLLSELHKVLLPVTESDSAAFIFLWDSLREFCATASIAFALCEELRREADETTGEEPTNYVVFGRDGDGQTGVFRARNVSEISAHTGVHVGKLVFADSPNATCAFQTRRGSFIVLRRRVTFVGRGRIPKFGEASEG